MEENVNKKYLKNLDDITPIVVPLLNGGKQIMLGYNSKNGNFYLSEVKATKINFENNAWQI